MVGITVCTVKAACKQDVVYSRSPSDDHVFLVPVSGPGVHPGDFVVTLCVKEYVCYAELSVCAEFQKEKYEAVQYMLEKILYDQHK